MFGFKIRCSVNFRQPMTPRLNELSKLLGWLPFLLGMCCSITSGLCDNASGGCPGFKCQLGDERYMRRGTAVLLTLIQEEYPYDSFQVDVDDSGVGHLRGHCGDSGDCPRPPAKAGADAASIDWTNRMSFLQRNVGWKILSLREAQRLWGIGVPQQQRSKGRHVYTVDTHSNNLGQEEILPPRS